MKDGVRNDAFGVAYRALEVVSGEIDKERVRLSAAAEAEIVREQAIALGTVTLSVAEFAQRFMGGASKHKLQKVRDAVRAKTLPAVVINGFVSFHLPTVFSFKGGVR